MKDLKQFIKTTIREFIEEKEINEGMFNRFKRNEIFKQKRKKTIIRQLNAVLRYAAHAGVESQR